MKKLLILSVLLGLMALPMFADHVSIDFGGDDSFGFISDFGDALAVDTSLTWDVIVGIDDYNSFTWSLADFSAGGTISLDKALVTTDMGMWAGLPVGLALHWGYDDPDMNEFQNISGYGNEDPWDFSSPSGEYWGLAILLSASMVEVELAFNPQGSGDGDLLIGLAAKEPVPGVNAEVYYYQNEKGGSVFDKGRIGLDAAYAGDVGPVALEAGAYFGYDLDDAATDAWAYGVGLSGAYSPATVTVGLDGNETDALAGLTATIDLDPIDMVTIYAGLQMDLKDAAAETFAGADLGITAHVGAVDVDLGYLITTVGDGDYNAPATLTDGGAYIKFDVDY
jgi:hypothetical protein